VQVAKLLAVNRGGVLTVQSHQALVCAAFHDPAFGKKHDKISVLRRLKIVSDEQGGGLVAEAIEGGRDFPFVSSGPSQWWAHQE